MPNAMVRIVSVAWIALCLLCCDVNANVPKPNEVNTSAPKANIDRLFNPQKVLVEVIQMVGIPRLPTQIEANGRPVTLAGIYAAGGLELDIRIRENVIPYAEKVAIDDLHGLMEEHRALTAPSGTWYVVLLILDSDSDAPETMELMFDYGMADKNSVPREGGAVYAKAHTNLSDEDLEHNLFLSAAHSLTHVFNLHHTDWEGMSFTNESTIEGYALASSVRWHLSKRSIAHLRYHPDRMVMPGGAEFASIIPEHDDSHQLIPRETYSVLVVPEETVEPGTFVPQIISTRTAGPRVIPVQPEDGFVSTQAEIELIATVAAGAVPIELVEVSVFGASQQVVFSSSDPGATAVLRVDVPLEAGLNEIHIVAEEQQGTRTIHRLSIEHETRVGKISAVVIGVDDYAHVAKLDYALADATAVRDLLVETFDISDDRIKYLANPTLREIRSALGTWLKRVSAKRDTVIVYFAGHGAAEEDESSVDSDNLSKYLLPVAAEPDDLYGTAYPMTSIAEVIRRVKADRVLFLIDACFSGSAGGRTINKPLGLRGVISTEFTERIIGQAKGRVIITASGPNQLAREDSELGHGLFTHYFLEGLRRYE